jgi:RNA polymerase sigma-70 factor (ECF subfamily)
MDDLIQRFLADRDLLLGYLRLLLPHDQAEDAFQEVFLVVHRRLGDYDRSRDFSAWVRGIARNIALKLRERSGRLRATAPDTLMALADRALDETDDDPAEDLSGLAGCLDRLKGDHRRLLDGRYREGRSIAELAVESGSTAGAVQVMLSRLRASLLDCLRRKRVMA